ncbi:hypothetical protein BRYFOR_09544 [Marvinbryantia formatexigens DSM 14469]|uniref:Uncharacterized protein n=1 Tax=Marvinbryantia formatexigens DSM 14469 TaxID=478749 RepID=C6LLJ6_9FIRM|nr:hypothetical protein BRYFOR_09544 [Marvinbryantia formatexigens DSM 14469]
MIICLTHTGRLCYQGFRKMALIGKYQTMYAKKEMIQHEKRAARR